MALMTGRRQTNEKYAIGILFFFFTFHKMCDKKKCDNPIGHLFAKKKSRAHPFSFVRKLV